MAGKESEMNRTLRKTRIIWDSTWEQYICERCKGVMYYDCDFKYCPFCRRKIVSKYELDARSRKSCLTRKQIGTTT